MCRSSRQVNACPHLRRKTIDSRCVAQAVSPAFADPSTILCQGLLAIAAERAFATVRRPIISSAYTKKPRPLPGSGNLTDVKTN